MTVMKPPSRFVRGDQVKIVDGTFKGHEGRVVDVNMQDGLVRVELIQFERPVPVELEFWQVEKVQMV
jgi:transcription termination/antitermination protein NusG